MARKKLGRRAITGALGLACVLAAGTSHASVLVSGIRVQCFFQNEFGEDEIFVKFNGVRLNMGNFSNGTDRTSPSNVTVSSLPVVAEIWEDDGNHWYDGDDQWQVITAASYGYYPRETHSSGGYQDHDYFWAFTLSII